MKTLFLSSVSMTGACIAVSICGMTSAEAASLSNLYELNGTLNDTLGGASLVSNGGTLAGGGGYVFNANQGPSLSNTINANNYSILMDFSLKDVGGYKKIVDFANLSSDNGPYNNSSELDFYPVAVGPQSSFSANVLARLVLTRDAATQTFTGYVNGVQQITFKDTGNDAVFSGPNRVAHFFQDDTVTSGGESTGGFLKKLAIYNGALSSQDVAALGGVNSPIGPAAIPTPALLPGLVGLGLGFLKKRKAEMVKRQSVSTAD
jgi:hypothetical protein